MVRNPECNHPGRIGFSPARGRVNNQFIGRGRGWGFREKRRVSTDGRACRYCGKPGHFIKFCRWIIADEAELKKQKPHGDRNHLHHQYWGDSSNPKNPRNREHDDDFSANMTLLESNSAMNYKMNLVTLATQNWDSWPLTRQMQHKKNRALSLLIPEQLRTSFIAAVSF